MILTRKQEEGLRIAVERYKNNELYTCIAGYAGTGKTTLVRFIIDALGIQDEDVCYISYTGKATLVLKEKGCLNAKTAHKLLYMSRPRKDGTFIHVPRRTLEDYYEIIVVDEISMLPKEMWELLLSHRIHVLALGDPAQLPPIGEDNGVLSHPHIFLDEVVRQAKESEIIRLSMDIREGKPLTLMKGNEVRVVPKSEICSGLLTWADQIIAAKNLTKHKINAQVRDILEYPANELVNGDKVICLKNNWDLVSSCDEPLVNGLIGTVSKVEKLKDRFINFKYRFDLQPDSIYDEDYFINIIADEKMFRTGEPTINKDNFRYIPKVVSQNLNLFDFAYCITCWKAQGSEYNKVLLMTEKDFPRDKETYTKYLYTGITRAKQKLIVVK